MASDNSNSTSGVLLIILPGIVKTLAIISIVAIGIFGVLRESTGTSDLLADYQFEPSLIRSYNPVFGNKDAKVTVIEFLDFQCPGCGAISPIVDQIREEYKGDVKFVFKMFPLPIHANAEISAQSAMAAAKQGKYFEFGTKLFAYQDNPGLSQITQEKVATELNLNMEQWNKDRKSQEIAKQILFDKTDGYKALLPLKEGEKPTSSVDSTPTFVFIKDGQILYKTNVMSADEFRARLDALLDKQPVAKPEAKVESTPEPAK